jgi:hypothetical protein
MQTGWTTKITKEGDKYKKTAYGKGQALDSPPAARMRKGLSDHLALAAEAE